MITTTSIVSVATMAAAIIIPVVIKLLINRAKNKF
jgi:hypothetical protein